MSQIVTRFAPSPTGHMHAGSYRTAFFAYLYARKHGGKFVLRIEDTDKERSEQQYTDEIFKVFETIGITYDEKYIQSEHVARHRECLQQLIDTDKAYISKEEAKDGSGVIKDIIRFRNPNRKVTFHDLIRGEITTDTTDLGDFVIAKNLEEPLFHLAVVIDDHDEGITHVIRAEEHIANTPRQILIHEALGFAVPHYAHLPLVLAPDKTKMSKRKGAVPVIEYLNRGYLPEALLNAICLCGWNPGTEQELFTRLELEQLFDLDHVQKGGAIFNEEKLNWFNREYIKKLSRDEQKMYIKKFLPESAGVGEVLLDQLVPIIIERIDYFAQVADMVAGGEFAYFVTRPEIDIKKVVWKNDTPSDTKKHLEQGIELLRAIPMASWSAESVREALWSYAETVGKGSLLWPIRFALSGVDKSPDPFTLAGILGQEETLARIESVCSKL